MKIIHQRDFKDCGVTCLEYIIEYYGGHVPIETLREDTFTDKNGTTAYHIVETLKKYGFDSFGQKISLEKLKDMVLPCIVHLILKNGLHHFAILEKVKKEEIILMDPAFGKRKLTYEEFGELWNGIVLLAIPASMIPKIPKEKNIILSLLYYIKKEYKLILPIVLFSLITSLISIVSSFYFKIGIEKVAFLEKKELWLLIGVFGTFSIFKMCFHYLKENFTIYLDKNIEIEYMYSFLSHLFCLPLSKFQSYQEGEIITRIEEAKEIKDLFHQVCITFFLESILGITSLLLLFSLNKKLTILVFCGMGFYIILNCFTSKYFYHLIWKNMEIEEKWNGFLLESIQIFPTIKHLNQTSYQLEKIEESLCDSRKEKLKISKSILFLQLIKANFMELFFFLLTTYGIVLIGNHTLNMLDFITFQSLYLYFITPIKELTDIGPKFYYMKGIFQKISDAMNWKEEKIKEYKQVVPISNIKIENLSFNYHQIKMIFQNLNIEIKEKEHVFLTGPSGCGKSTFCKILRREIEPYEGEIYLSSKNIKDYELSFLRASIIYLSQGEHLISGTIKENILFGKKESERLSEVIKICEIESIVSKKNFRYDSKITNESLSGGEKQRMMLARTLMQEGSIYILDECLSEVEKKLEIKIIKHLRKFLHEKTLIYISHTEHAKYFERSIDFENKNNLE